MPIVCKSRGIGESLCIRARSRLLDSGRLRQTLVPAHRKRDFRYNPSETRRDGRAAEGGGLLNRYRVKSSIGGSNPPLSASLQHKSLILFINVTNQTN